MKTFVSRVSVGVVMAGLVATMGVGAAEAEEGGVEVSVSADVVSAYVFRGVTLNDGPALEPGVEVSGLPITFGVWGNLDLSDYDDNLKSGQFSEIDLYASYDIPIEIMSLSVGYTEYTYPNGGEADREVGLTAGKEGPVDVSLGLYYGIDGAIEKSFYAELGLGREVPLGEDVALSLGATVGFLAPDEGDSGFSHFTASADLTWKMLTVGVTYIGQIDDDVLSDYAPATEESDASLGYDTEVVGKIGVSAAF